MPCRVNKYSASLQLTASFFFASVKLLDASVSNEKFP
jgi:hypothetical protein